MNKSLFRSTMVLHGDTYETLADFLEKSKQTVCNKVNENGTEFTQGEIAKIKKRWNLSAEQVLAIFFA